MSSNNEGLGRVLTVALALCIVCSVVVSTAAVVLKPQQQANKTRDLKRNILLAAGIYDAERSIEEQFERVSTRVIDVEIDVAVVTEVVVLTIAGLRPGPHGRVRRVGVVDIRSCVSRLPRCRLWGSPI